MLNRFLASGELWPQFAEFDALQQLPHILRGTAEDRFASLLFRLGEATQYRTDDDRVHVIDV